MAQIKKDTSLRKAILQAAITGQLISDIGGESLPLAAAGKPSSATPSAGTPRNAPTETGKQLLDRIIEERNKKLLADWEEKQTDLFASNDAHSKNAKTVRSEQIRLSKKIKKPEPIVASEIDEDEIPFEIPENWCWCRLGDICLVKGGKRIPAGCTLTDIDTGHKYIRVADMKNGSVIVENVKYITDEIHDKIKAYKISKDDVYITVAGTIGDSGIIPDELDNANLTENADKLVLFNGINKYCLHFFLSSGFFQEQISDAITKVGQPKLAIIRIQNFLLPLPPLAVQNAIVETLEQVLPLVDAYENALLQKEELKSALPDKIKKAILQEAITGQLTEAWRKSATIKESGKQLLDRIIEERNAKALADWEEALKKNPKAKKSVPVVASEIDEEEIPFEVPESWCWCRLGDLGDFVRGSGIKRDETRSEGFPCIRYGEMYTRYKTVINETVSFVDKNVFDKCQKIIKNDIAMALTGENEYDIALAAVYTGDKEIAMGGDMTRFRPAFVNSLFLVFALNSPYGIECKSELATGNIIVHISNDKLGSIMIPLPPLEEQAEIVKKVEELLPLCK
ncbi:MAG: restriction endonuclease subunit S [Treponema sp.]|nr:restriction endonuclease subunit S [Treponema sp.]